MSVGDSVLRLKSFISAERVRAGSCEEVAKDDTDIVSALLTAIAGKVGQERFALWFGSRAQFAWDGQTLVVTTPNRFFHDWVRSRFGAVIEQACGEVLPCAYDLRFEVLTANTASREAPALQQGGEDRPGAAPTSRSSRTAQPTSTEAPRKRPSQETPVPNRGRQPQRAHPAGVLRDVLSLAAAGPEPSRRNGGAQRAEVKPSRNIPSASPRGGAKRAVGESPGSHPAAQPTPVEAPTIGLRAEHRSDPKPAAESRVAGMPRRRWANLDEFVVGPSNRLAFAAVEAVLRQPGQVSPLTIFGPTAVGKTHLLEGTYRAIRRRYPRCATLYQSAEQFTSAFIDALRGSGVPSFRQKFRGVHLLIIDDLHFFRGKQQTQIELTYTIDSLLREGRQVILAADRSPAELRELGPELISRLQSGMVCRIDPPDFGTRHAIVERIAREISLALPGDVAHWIAQRFTRHARQLSGVLCRLKTASRAYHRPVDLNLAADALADLLADAQPSVHLADIDQAIRDTFGLGEGELQSRRRDRAVSHPRMLAMWLARRYTRAPLSEIGRHFGNRSHATVISAHKRVESWLAESGEIALAQRRCAVADVIRQVERRLRVC